MNQTEIEIIIVIQLGIQYVIIVAIKDILLRITTKEKKSIDPITLLEALTPIIVLTTIDLGMIANMIDPDLEKEINPTIITDLITDLDIIIDLKAVIEADLEMDTEAMMNIEAVIEVMKEEIDLEADLPLHTSEIFILLILLMIMITNNSNLSSSMNQCRQHVKLILLDPLQTPTRLRLLPILHQLSVILKSRIDLTKLLSIVVPLLV